MILKDSLHECNMGQILILWMTVMFSPVMGKSHYLSHRTGFFLFIVPWIQSFKRIIIFVNSATKKNYLIP